MVRDMTDRNKKSRPEADHGTAGGFPVKEINCRYEPNRITPVLGVADRSISSGDVRRNP